MYDCHVRTDYIDALGSIHLSICDGDRVLETWAVAASISGDWMVFRLNAGPDLSYRVADAPAAIRGLLNRAAVLAVGQAECHI